MEEMRKIGLFFGLCWWCAASFGQPTDKPYNVVFILSDDHRYDFMGFMDKVPGLETPNMDRMAREGAHLQNAFVSTALCSPSRASILTGQYAHTHTIVDNNAPLPEGLTFFPQYLQQEGYKTGFFGKWHMGNMDGSKQPGFDQWVSFRDQGVYYSPTFNINGEEVKQPEGSYTTDLLTDYAIDWLNSLDDGQPFFLYLSHKGVHAEFNPAERHRGTYKDMPVICPPSMYLTATDSSRHMGIETPYDGPVNPDGIPEWVRKQRYSWHGVDYMYDGQIAFEDFYRQYCETLRSVDESIGAVIEWLEQQGLAENTLVFYMGDNGFLFGEQGLIDKRNAYEASMRVPLLAWSPKFVRPHTQIKQMVMNVDIGPTILDLAGIAKPAQMQGDSFLPLLQNKPIEGWRNKVFYEYYWEWAFPQTPTIFAIRTDRYKYIFNQGIWDTNELYDLQTDPYEMNNLIRDPASQEIAGQLKKELWDWLESTDGMQIPLKKIYQRRNDHRYRGTY
ncbi:acetylglucosamine-6-sulfatase [Parapedobacter defluvii]|uniref:Acetylglucosamine-6-sulfatase n=2 Tax=Parapedobacter defluvii TaxID=2045106 RepID=A0ABQ1MJE9_9SPHI|nr:acetylglucosamine-6-sulfatase [Parapedobacter defluvii]